MATRRNQRGRVRRAARRLNDAELDYVASDFFGPLLRNQRRLPMLGNNVLGPLLPGQLRGRTAAQRARRARQRARQRQRGRQFDGRNAPLAIAANNNMQSPIVNSAQGIMIVSHREFIADVIGSVDFNNVLYQINPGLAQVFPWLSNMARNFDKYRFKRLAFQYAPSSAAVNPGVVMMAMDLDAADTKAETKKELMNFQNASNENVWKHSTTEMPEQQPLLYVRSGAPPANTDIKTYDAGSIQIATSNCVADSNVGQLFVDYVVELHVPQSNNMVPFVESLYVETVDGTTIEDGISCNNQLSSLPAAAAPFIIGTVTMAPGSTSTLVLIRITFNATALATGASKIGGISLNVTGATGPPVITPGANLRVLATVPETSLMIGWRVAIKDEVDLADTVFATFAVPKVAGTRLRALFALGIQL